MERRKSAKATRWARDGARRRPPARSRLLLPILAAVAPALLVACSQEPPPPPSAVMEEVEIVEEEIGGGPESARLLLENPWITAVRVHLAAGERLAFHRGGERVVWAENPHALRLSPEGRAPSTVRAAAGEVLRHPSGPLRVENVGPTVARYVMVVRSAEPLPATAAHGGRDGGGGPGAGAPGLRQVGEGRVELLWKDPVCRVLRVDLGPGGRLPKHGGDHRVVYSLAPYDLKYLNSGADVVEVAFQAGEAHWHEAGVHAVENLGPGPARYLLFTFLR